MSERRRYMLSTVDLPYLDACLKIQELDTLCYEVLRCKAQGNSYRDCAKRFGRSRPWYAMTLRTCYDKYEVCKPKVMNIVRAYQDQYESKPEEPRKEEPAREEEPRQERIEEQVIEVVSKEPEKKERPKRQDKEELKTASRVSPERLAESAALKKVGLIAAKQAEKLVSLYQRIGQLFYEKFIEIKETTGKEWEELVEEAYQAYINHGIEREEEIDEYEILATLIQIALQE